MLKISEYACASSDSDFEADIIVRAGPNVQLRLQGDDQVFIEIEDGIVGSVASNGDTIEFYHLPCSRASVGTVLAWKDGVDLADRGDTYTIDIKSESGNQFLKGTFGINYVLGVIARHTALGDTVSAHGPGLSYRSS